MKRLFAAFIIILIFLVSCLEDADTLRKKSLFGFYDDMKLQLLDDNIDWIKNNSDIEDIETIKDVLINDKDSIKNLMSSSNAEYSVTINYTIGDNTSPYRGYYIIRNTEFSPTYYYIRLVNKSATKWVIESIDKLPLN